MGRKTAIELVFRVAEWSLVWMGENIQATTISSSRAQFRGSDAEREREGVEERRESAVEFISGVAKMGGCG